MTAKTPKNKGPEGAHWISNPQGPRLLTLKDAASWLGLTLWAMRERVWQGQIPYVQFDGGRKIYIDTKDLEQFIQKHKQIFS